MTPLAADTHDPYAAFREPGYRLMLTGAVLASFGLEFAWFNQTYNDGVDANNYRAQGSAFFIF